MIHMWRYRSWFAHLFASTWHKWPWTFSEFFFFCIRKRWPAAPKVASSVCQQHTSSSLCYAYVYASGHGYAEIRARSKRPESCVSIELCHIDICTSCFLDIRTLIVLFPRFCAAQLFSCIQAPSCFPQTRRASIIVPPSRHARMSSTVSCAMVSFHMFHDAPVLVGMNRRPCSDAMMQVVQALSCVPYRPLGLRRANASHVPAFWV